MSRCMPLELRMQACRARLPLQSLWGDREWLDALDIESAEVSMPPPNLNPLKVRACVCVWAGLAAARSALRCRLTLCPASLSHQ